VASKGGKDGFSAANAEVVRTCWFSGDVIAGPGTKAVLENPENPQGAAAIENGTFLIS